MWVVMAVGNGFEDREEKEKEEMKRDARFTLSCVQLELASSFRSRFLLLFSLTQEEEDVHPD